MNYLLTTTMAFLFLLLSTQPLFAQGEGNEWDILYREVEELYCKRKYDHAIVIAKKALEVAEKRGGPNHPDVVNSLNNLAVLYRIQGQYTQAEPLYKRALEIREKTLGPDHPDMAISLNNLATLYHTLGQYAQAEPLYKCTLKIYEKSLRLDHPYVARSLKNLAALYRAMKRDKEAEALEQRAACCLSDPAKNPVA